MNDNHILAQGMTRALGVVKDCEGDLDFAIFVIEKDIEALKKAADAMQNEQSGQPEETRDKP